MVVTALLFAATPARAECYPESARAAEETADGVRDWHSLYAAFARFGNCDDGAVGEGFSDSVARLLAEHWGSVTVLNRLAIAHPKFKRFVLHHIDSLMSPNQVRTIKQNASLHCPADSRAMCDTIVAQIRVASRG